MPIIPENDPNEAYDVGHMPAVPHGLPPDWWTAFCNGIPVYHFAPDKRETAEHYATDPAYRLGLVTRFLHARPDSQSRP
jgi:hypothetical protein